MAGKIDRSDPSINYKLLRQEFMRTRLKLTNEARKLKSNSPELMKFVSDNQKIVGTWKDAEVTINPAEFTQQTLI